MRKFLLLHFVFVSLLIQSVPVFSESLDIIAHWMDLFFLDERDPWTLKKTDLSFLNKELGTFDCRNGVNNNNEYLMTCNSKKGSYEGSYRLIFNFGDKNDLVLDAVEILAYHPYLNKRYEKFGEEATLYELKSFKSLLRSKSYVAEYKTKYNPQDTVHSIMTPNTTYYDCFDSPKVTVSIGYIEDKLILNFSSQKYFRDHYYIIDKDPVTGELKKYFVSN